ncbi:unnamed protein product [Ranitomeya imitator]|uniref:UBX domain-containing protein n=1 Tax=Ranitomeya imitator TaxID=111125 RepID=A0ABN9LGP7_9NEOB|nr:unnamed protein product [Ranitomeya imitator]
MSGGKRRLLKKKLQVYHDSEEGQRYIQFYKLSDFPYVSILDPRTGQKMVEWHKLDVNSFLEQVMGFLTEHGQLDGLSSSPPKKRLRSESLIDASEDSQLEAAIRASLQETHFDSSASKQPGRYEEESDTELYSGSEEFISVCGSDHEDEKEERLPESLPEQGTSSSKSRKATTKTINHRKDDLCPLEPVIGEDDSSNHHLLPENPPTESQDVKDNFGNDESSEDCPDTSNGPKAKLMLRYPDGKREQISLPEKAKLMRRCSDTDNDPDRCSVAVWSLESCHTDRSPATNDAGNQGKHRVTKRRAALSNPMFTLDTMLKVKKTNTRYLPTAVCPPALRSASLLSFCTVCEPESRAVTSPLCFPAHSQYRRSAEHSAGGQTAALVKHVQQRGYPNERFELLTNFPRRKLSHLDYDITLQDAGLCPQETVFVQERN